MSEDKLSGSLRVEHQELRDELFRAQRTGGQEHKQIVKALRDLIRAARDEKHTGFAQFATKRIAHAQLEEGMLYPAAILVGDSIRLALGKSR